MTDIDKEAIRARLAASASDEWNGHPILVYVGGDAVSDIAALLDALDEAEERIERLQERNLQWESGLNITGDEFDITDLRAEVLRLTAQKDKALELIDSNDPNVSWLQIRGILSGDQ